MRSLCRSFCAICPASSRHACMSGYLPGNGQRTALPWAARSIAVDRGNKFPLSDRNSPVALDGYINLKE